MLEENFLVQQYVHKKKSAAQIGVLCKCSPNKVTYWLQKYNIQKRSISDAVYVHSNPDGDPFEFNRPKNNNEWFLYGLGLGLFWGEGNKVNKNSVRLGNTDIDLIRCFLFFLKQVYKIDENKLRFGLQLFSDISPERALMYWSGSLGVSRKQFQKVVVTKSVQKGTYKRKSEFGVLTVYFSNTKLRDSIISAITELRQQKEAILAQSVERIHGKSH